MPEDRALGDDFQGKIGDAITHTLGCRGAVPAPAPAVIAAAPMVAWSNEVGRLSSKEIDGMVEWPDPAMAVIGELERLREGKIREVYMCLLSETIPALG